MQFDLLKPLLGIDDKPRITLEDGSEKGQKEKYMTYQEVVLQVLVGTYENETPESKFESWDVAKKIKNENPVELTVNELKHIQDKACKVIIDIQVLGRLKELFGW